MPLHQPGQKIVGTHVIEFFVADFRIVAQIANQRFVIGEKMASMCLASG
jgi:hypothetical protein